MPCGGSPYGDANLLFVANDWHTALVPVYLQVGGWVGGWVGAVCLPLCHHVWLLLMW